MVLDSTPGKFHWNRVHETYAAMAPRWMSLVLHVGIALVVVLNALSLSQMFPLPKMMAALNSESITKQQKRRTYIFSGTDKMIAAEDVKAHGEEAREKGFEVRFEDFGESAHVQHMRSDPERYWGVVRETWQGN
jgi:hypothetical protein